MLWSGLDVWHLSLFLPTSKFLLSAKGVQSKDRPIVSDGGARFYVVLLGPVVPLY